MSEGNIGNIGFGWNLDKPTIYVQHRQMKPATAEYAVECAKCRNGILWTSHDDDHKIFLPEDTCDICGQNYFYMDAKEIAIIRK